MSTKTAATKRTDTRKIAMLALLCAISYVVMYVSKMIFAAMPVAGFLTFDLKDVIIAIGGFIFGPVSVVAVSLIVSLIEMVTVSSTGIIGMIMNVLSTCAFVCPAAAMYKRGHSLKNAVIGLVIGAVAMTAVMVLWNYLITPLYMNVPREVVVTMLIPTFLPFNVIKAAMNAAATMLLYKPIITGLRKAKLIAPFTGKSAPNKRRTIEIALIALFVLATSVLLGLVLSGVI